MNNNHDPLEFEFNIPKGSSIFIPVDIVKINDMKPDDPALNTEIVKSLHNIVKNTPEIQEAVKREKMQRAAGNN